MSPTRKVLVGIGVLVLVMLGAVPLSWHLQHRALGDALISDLQASAARTVTRSPPLADPKHENGYGCYAAMIDVTPADLSPFEMKDGGVFAALMDAGVVEEPWRSKMTSLEPWAASVRSCGNSATLAFVPGLTPFAPFSDVRSARGSQVLLALSRMTRLQARLLWVDEAWEEIAALCAGTLEVALDRSHLGLVGAMVAASNVRLLAPQCGAALRHTGLQSRKTWGKRFGALPARLISNEQLIDLERQAMGLAAFGWLLSDEQRAKTPPSESFTSNEPLSRLATARLWGRWDRAMRHLAEAAQEGNPERLEASLALDEAFSAWWLPSDLQSRPEYEKFFLRRDDTAVLLGVLTALASGNEVSLSSKLVQTASGLEFTDSQGEKILIP